MRLFSSIAFYLLFFSKIYSQPNLVLNPGFESGLTNWTPFSTNTVTCSVQIDNAIFHSVSKSLHISIMNSGSLETAVGLQWIQIKKGGHYLFECYVKTNNLSGLNAEALPYLLFKEDTVRLFGDGGLPVDGTTNWKKIKLRFSPPHQCDTVQLGLVLIAKNGDAWFDDISIKEDTVTSYHAFNVNLNLSTGDTIKTYMGTNVGPVDPPLTFDLTPKFTANELGIDYVRTHDYTQSCDMHVIFPDTSGNPLDPAAYDFSSTDIAIKAIIDAGCKVYFRLGERGSADTSFFLPPTNYDKWAQVCLQIVKHYNEGWNNGFLYNINYWEIYNEPDVPGLWKGTVQEFIKLYRTTAIKLKSHNPSLKIGGPAVSTIYSKELLHEFLDSVQTYNLPLDFFSYHYYHTLNPFNFFEIDGLAKTLLNQYGLGSTERIVSEWSTLAFSYANDDTTWRDDPFMTASTVAALTYYQKTDVSKLFRYRTNEHDLGMINANGDYTYTGMAHRLFAVFPSVPVEIYSDGSDSLGTTILAGTSLPQDAAAVIVANNNSASNGYTINFSGFTSNTYTYNVIRVDSTDSMSVVANGILSSSSPMVSVGVKASFSDLIILSKLPPTAINEPGSHSEIYVFPNPVVSRTTIVIDESDIQSMQLIDVYGRVVKTFDIASSQHFISWERKANNGAVLADGIYFLRVISPDHHSVIKIILTQE